MVLTLSSQRLLMTLNYQSITNASKSAVWGAYLAWRQWQLKTH
mgnify:CR=1 FL=1